MVITLKQAVDQRMTPSDLRVLANSLERIARDGYVYEEEIMDDDGGYDHMITVREPAYDYRSCIENAASLRRVAGELQRLNARVKNA